MGAKSAPIPKPPGDSTRTWLNMMYPRLKLARNLLREDGVIFINLDDNEVDNITAILKEILERLFDCR
jgi:adenine-specific DNA-methyltransferase